jgi:hypothetical protein
MWAGLSVQWRHGCLPQYPIQRLLDGPILDPRRDWLIGFTGISVLAGGGGLQPRGQPNGLRRKVFAQARDQRQAKGPLRACRQPSCLDEISECKRLVRRNSADSTSRESSAEFLPAHEDRRWGRGWSF